MSENPREMVALMMIVTQLIKDEVERDHREQANRHAAHLRNIVDRFLKEEENG